MHASTCKVAVGSRCLFQGKNKMARTLKVCIGELARLRRIELRPNWSAPIDDLDNLEREDFPEAVAKLGWPAPAAYPARDARAHAFPLLVHHAQLGWAVAERMESELRLSVLKNGKKEEWFLDDDLVLFELHLPEPPSEAKYETAMDVFVAAIARRKRVLILAVIATFAVNLIALATSLYSMQVYDRVIPRGNFSTLWALTVGLIAAIGFDFVLRVVRARLLEQEATAIDSEVSEYFFARANDVRLDARPPSVGTMAAQLKGLEQVRSTMSSAVLFTVADLPFAILFILVVASIGGVIAIVTAVSFPLSVGIALIIGRIIRSDTKKSQVSSNKKSGLLVEAIDSAETMKAARGQWFFLKKWNELIDEVHHSDLPVRNTQSVAGSIFGTIQQFAYTGIIAWGAVQVYDHHMTQGGLIACSILASRINGPLIVQLPSLIVGWTYTKISLGMLDGILKLPADKAPGAELLRPSRIYGALSVREVAFVHHGARVGLNVPTFDVLAGQRVGIIGAVGSGKSTLLRILSGLYAPNEGRVMLDGLDVGTIADDILRKNVGYLPQDYRLVNGTLRENLLLGLSDPGDDVLMAAAAATGLADMVAQHPQGVDLPIGEGGRGLSGGQRALAGFTRMLIAQPKVWLLDEPTSNLDGDSEGRVMKALQENLARDATLILVTHKPQLLRLVERVVVIANGQIVMDGPTNEVMGKLSTPKAVAPPQKTNVPVATVPVGGNA